MSAKARGVASTELAPSLLKEILDVKEVMDSNSDKDDKHEPVASSTPEKPVSSGWSTCSYTC